MTNEERQNILLRKVVEEDQNAGRWCCYDQSNDPPELVHELRDNTNHPILADSEDIDVLFSSDWLRHTGGITFVVTPRAREHVERLRNAGGKTDLQVARDELRECREEPQARLAEEESRRYKLARWAALIPTLAITIVLGFVVYQIIKNPWITTILSIIGFSFITIIPDSYRRFVGATVSILRWIHSWS
jgi:hypothetical protein